MRRVVTNTATVISLAVSILASALFARSYFRLDDIAHIGQWHIHNFSSHKGRAFVQIGWSTEDEIEGATGRHAAGGFFFDSVAGGSLAVERKSRGWAVGGFDYFTSKTKRLNALGRPAAGESVVIVPWWFVVIAGAVLPAVWLVGRYRSIRLASCRGFTPEGFDN